MQPIPQSRTHTNFTTQHAFRSAEEGSRGPRARVPAPSPHRYTAVPTYYIIRINAATLGFSTVRYSLRYSSTTSSTQDCRPRRSVAAPQFTMTLAALAVKWPLVAVLLFCAKIKIFTAVRTFFGPACGPQFSKRNWRQDTSTKSSDFWRGERTAPLWCCDTSRR